jgi:hypothetical protein
LYRYQYRCGKESFLKVEFIDFQEQLEYIEQREEKETKDKYVMAAYATWLQGKTDKKTFGEYLSVLGLGEKPKKMTPAQRKRVALKGLRTANRILKMKGKNKKK